MAVSEVNRRRGVRIGDGATWFATIVPALIFLMSGLSKLFAQAPNPENFARWGYPGFFMYVVGVAEFVGALALLVPRVATIGAAILGVITLGAIVTHIFAGEFMALSLPLALLALVTVVGVARRDLLPVRQSAPIGARASRRA
jgi:putative oxidoreductase